VDNGNDDARAAWADARRGFIEEHSLVPLLTGERPPRGTSFEEYPFIEFLAAAQLAHGRDIRTELVAVERLLNTRGLTLATLFDWPHMLWNILKLVEWKQVRRPRGRRPKHEMTRALEHLGALLTSPHISNHARLVFTGEYGRLRKLLDTAPTSLLIAPATLAPLDLPLNRVRSLVRRADKWQFSHGPWGWNDAIREAHAQLVRRGGLTEREAIRMLCDLLLLLFPQWFMQDVRDAQPKRQMGTRRVRALIADSRRRRNSRSK
jgi:hypothetical protein